MNTDDLERDTYEGLLPPAYEARRKKGDRPGWKRGRHKHTAATKEKIRRAMTGRRLSEETKRRISEARRYGVADRLRQVQEELTRIEQEIERNPRLKRPTFRPTRKVEGWS